MKALSESWPFIPEVHLFHNREKADRFIRKRLGMVPRFLSTGAQTWSVGGTAVVLMEYSGDCNTEAALLVHEAYHVAYRHFRDYVGEEQPSEEFMAYGVQVVSKALFKAHGTWRDSR